MNWKVSYLPEAADDLLRLDGSAQRQVLKAIAKVSQNPLPFTEGGYGKPLGNKQSKALTGLQKIKLKAADIRIIYDLIRTETMMLIVVIGIREDGSVYAEAMKRIQKNGD